MKSINLAEKIKKTASFLYSCCNIYLLFLIIVFVLFYAMYDDKSYCLDIGYRIGDKMCQKDDNNKLIVVK